MTLNELKKSTTKKNFDQIVSDLKQAFMHDFTDEEACRYARINPDTYYTWKNASEEFVEEMTIAKDFIVQAAKNNIGNKVAKGDIELSKWWLERRRRDDYANKTQTDVTSLGQSINFPEFDILSPKEKDAALDKKAKELAEELLK
jgi:hypothetical protein